MAEPPPLTNDEARDWLAERAPDAWFSHVEALVDRDEIMFIGTLHDSAHEDAATDEPSDAGAGTTDADEADPSVRRAERAAIEDFRERTRDERVAIAQRAEATFRRKASWATGCGETTAAFTHLSVPVMTRLRIKERHTLDTLVAAGVARSRSDALGWCVRLVAQHEGPWLDELREAIGAVDEIRSRGPRSTR